MFSFDSVNQKLQCRKKKQTMGSKKRRSFTNKYGDPSLTGEEGNHSPTTARRSEDYMPDENDWVSRAYIPTSSSDRGCFTCCCASSDDSESGQSSCCGPCTSYTSKAVAVVMMICLVILAGLGIGLMVFGAMEQVKPVVRLCSTCNGITIASLVAWHRYRTATHWCAGALSNEPNSECSVSVLMLLICAMFHRLWRVGIRYDRDASVIRV